MVPWSQGSTSAASSFLWCFRLAGGLTALGPVVATAGDGAPLQAKITYLWPIHMATVPLTKQAPEGSSLEAPILGQELAKIGLDGFEKYLSSTLPKELELDKPFAQHFRSEDHSRVNNGFIRWQKRVFADRVGVPPTQLTSLGQSIPRLEGIDYGWPELYGSAAFKTLSDRILELSRLYLKRVGYTEIPEQFRLFIWAEVFKKGDALRPGTRTDGAYLAGKYFASGKAGCAKLNFEDSRGINPPFGKTFSHTVEGGNMVLFPVWSSYFVSPNMRDEPLVSYGFMLYPAEGNTLHFRDDLTASLAVNFSVNLEKKKS